MLGLMKKDWLHYIGFLMVIPLQFAYWKTTRMQLDTTVVFMMTGWLYIVILGIIFGVEMNETKNRGYAFLASLPITAREIVGAKLIPIFVISAVYVLATYFSFSSLEVEPVHLALSRKWLLFNAGFAICMAGLLYWFIFRYGLDKAMYLQGILFLFSFIVPIGLNELVIRGYIDQSSAIFRMAGSAGNGSLLVLGSAVFFWFYHISVRALERERLS
jgi:hypothetical protein